MIFFFLVAENFELGENECWELIIFASINLSYFEF
jgi:hypothetical protein